jgi:hypothetical protein
MYQLYRYIVLNGQKYAIQQGTYVRKWQRQFTATLSANIVELNFVDRGPGILTYDMTLMVAQWGTNSQLYADGLTLTVAQQLANLEAAYQQVASPLTFIDPFGNAPVGGLTVYFTDLQQTIPKEATVQTPIVLMDIELIAAETAIS